MARMLAFCLAMLLIVTIFHSSSEAQKVNPDRPEWIPANPYRRGCKKTERCGRAEMNRKLLAVKTLPKVSSHGLQDDIGNRN
ncbi:hypothetical protein CASFOL_031332 [Castilleja foliolosa]|uniref:Rapid ALkalinization Factor n=1 Tax=Castilleja foliolosa TaxID=1961234 RepID=A0ABD3C5E6_9LAMI